MRLRLDDPGTIFGLVIVALIVIGAIWTFLEH